MIKTTYNTRTREWKAVASFPHSNPYKYNMFSYAGHGATPEQATLNLLSLLSEGDYGYYYTYWHDESLTTYDLTTAFNHYDLTWMTQVSFVYEAPHGSAQVDSLLSPGAPDPATAAVQALGALADRQVSVWIARNQRREAHTLFSH